MKRAIYTVTTIRGEDGKVIVIVEQGEIKIYHDGHSLALSGVDAWHELVSGVVEAMGLEAIPSEIQERILEGTVNRRSGR